MPTKNEIVMYLCRLFKEKGFINRPEHESGGSKIYVSEDKILRIGIFPEDYSNTNSRNVILADHESLFDKWSKHYYCADFPTSRVQCRMIVEDLSYIKTANNLEASSKFGKITRTFI